MRFKETHVPHKENANVHLKEAPVPHKNSNVPIKEADEPLLYMELTEPYKNVNIDLKEAHVPYKEARRLIGSICASWSGLCLPFKME